MEEKCAGQSPSVKTEERTRYGPLLQRLGLRALTTNRKVSPNELSAKNTSGSWRSVTNSWPLTDTVAQLHPSIKSVQPRSWGSAALWPVVRVWTSVGLCLSLGPKGPHSILGSCSVLNLLALAFVGPPLPHATTCCSEL